MATALGKDFTLVDLVRERDDLDVVDFVRPFSHTKGVFRRCMEIGAIHGLMAPYMRRQTLVGLAVVAACLAIVRLDDQAAELPISNAGRAASCDRRRAA
jgi:hypothetical protein